MEQNTFAARVYAGTMYACMYAEGMQHVYMQVCPPSSTIICQKGEPSPWSQQLSNVSQGKKTIQIPGYSQELPQHLSQ